MNQSANDSAVDKRLIAREDDRAFELRLRSHEMFQPAFNRRPEAELPFVVSDDLRRSATQFNSDAVAQFTDDNSDGTATRRARCIHDSAHQSFASERQQLFRLTEPPRTASRENYCADAAHSVGAAGAMFHPWIGALRFRSDSPVPSAKIA